MASMIGSQWINGLRTTSMGIIDRYQYRNTNAKGCSMVLKRIVILILMLLAAANRATAGADKQNPPMVISVSWSSPDTRYLRRHIDEWERLPFTGTLVTASWPQTEAGSVDLSTGTNSLSWSVFRGERFTPQMLEGPLNDLRDTKFTRDHDNFLWVV